MKREERQIIEALYKAIGYNLQQHRLRIGASFLEMELATALTASAIHEYEKGEKPIPMIDLVKLSQYFGVSPGVMFEGIPILVTAAPSQGFQGFSDAHVDEFQQNFLKVTGPGRGDKFKRFIKKISDEDDSSGTTH